MKSEPEHTVDLLRKLREISDPRRREGKLYPLHSLLGMLILAALNGESSLRGMVMWGAAHWQQIKDPLEFKPTHSAPVYGTVWTVLSKLPPEELEPVFAVWLTDSEQAAVTAIDIDGKYLRGSKRRASQLPAMQVLTAAAQGIGVVLGQGADAETDTLQVAVALLRRLPLANKVVTMDAGLMHPGVTETILEKGGPIWGYSKVTTGRSLKQ